MLKQLYPVINMPEPGVGINLAAGYADQSAVISKNKEHELAPQIHPSRQTSYL